MTCHHDDAQTAGWRGAVATWSAAAWMVMQQFGVPAASVAATETRIVRSEDITRSLTERETLPDGRIITIPVEVTGDHDTRNRDYECVRHNAMSLN